jgi:RNA polymerase sigma-70 factor (ECF subfamily)
VDGTIYETWRARLLGFCRQLLRHSHDAEEVVQDVFTRLLAEPHRYDLEVEPEVLLFRMARNRCIDLRRKHQPTPVAALVVAAPDTGRSAELSEAIAVLPLPEREVLLLTAIDGLGYREVAAIVGCALGTVAARKYAAIQRLRRRLEP